MCKTHVKRDAFPIRFRNGCCKQVSGINWYQINATGITSAIPFGIGFPVPVRRASDTGPTPATEHRNGRIGPAAGPPRPLPARHEKGAADANPSAAPFGSRSGGIPARHAMTRARPCM